MTHAESQQRYIKSIKGRVTRQAYEDTLRGRAAKLRADKTYRDKRRADLIQAQAEPELDYTILPDGTIKAK